MAKRLSLLVQLFVCQISLANLSLALDVPDAKSTITPSFYTCAIHAADLNQAVAPGRGMFEIRSSGRYYLSGDLCLSPNNSGVTIIKILANNVTLNLNMAVICQREDSRATDLVGIEIANNIYSATIFNGKIAYLKGQGIRVSAGVCEVLIKDLVVCSCHSDCAAVIGFELERCHSVRIEQCLSVNHSNSRTLADAAAITEGFRLTNCTSCILQGCTASWNGSISYSSYGFRLVGSKYCQLLKCVAMSQFSLATGASLVVGFSCSGGQANHLRGCKSIGNRAGSNSLGIGAGFILGDDALSGEKYSSITKCCAECNDGGAGTGYGIKICSGVFYCQLTHNKLLANVGDLSGNGLIDHNSPVRSLYSRNFAHAV